MSTLISRALSLATLSLATLSLATLSLATLSLATLSLDASAGTPQCLPSPDLDDVADGDGILYTSGLTLEQVADAMDDAHISAAACVDHGEVVTGAVEVSLRVDCAGQVVEVDVGRVTGLRPEIVSCVRDVFVKTPFPAHDLPGGFDFGYVMTLDFSH